VSEENENIRFSSYEHVSMKPDEKEEVFERLVGSMTGEKSRKNRWIPTLLTAALVSLFILAGGYALMNGVITTNPLPTKRLSKRYWRKSSQVRMTN